MVGDPRFDGTMGDRLRLIDMKRLVFVVVIIILFSYCIMTSGQETKRPRARAAGVIVGVLPTGPLNAITDVAGVAIGHTTIVKGDSIRTGVTAILPHGGNLFREKVPGAVFIGNAFGKLAGSTQVNELGEIETPIMLTSTLNVPRVADATIDYMLALPGNENVQSINPLVGETNDGYLKDELEKSRASGPANNPNGSIMIVIATDAPINHRNLQRLAARSMMGLARTGSAGSNGSGDFAIAFSTAPELRIRNLPNTRTQSNAVLLSNEAMSPLFLAVIEATEEAIYNSLFRATTTTGRGHTVEALPIDRTLEILRRHGALLQNRER